MLNEALQEMGYASDELHGDLSQAKREQVMKVFRDASCSCSSQRTSLRAGSTWKALRTYLTIDIPQDVESYIHRIGRTGRAGESGLAITLIAPKGSPRAWRISRTASSRRSNAEAKTAHRLAAPAWKARAATAAWVAAAQARAAVGAEAAPGWLRVAALAAVNRGASTAGAAVIKAAARRRSRARATVRGLANGRTTGRAVRRKLLAE